MCEVRVSDRLEYQGKGIGLVDDKGRVAIPNALRTALAKNAPRADGKDGGTVLVGDHPDFPCLIAYDRGYVPLLKQQLLERRNEAAAKIGSPEYYAARMAVGSGEEVTFDGSGRLILPSYERKSSGIADVAFFLGDIENFMIWEPRRLVAHPAIEERIKNQATFLCAEKGIVL